jgi:hypothetical protein
MAEAAPLEAKDAVEITRACELASHNRWRASKADVVNFGDKRGIGGAPGLPPVEAPQRHDFEIARRLAFILERGKIAAEEM